MKFLQPFFLKQNKLVLILPLIFSGVMSVFLRSKELQTANGHEMQRLSVSHPGPIILITGYLMLWLSCVANYFNNRKENNEHRNLKFYNRSLIILFVLMSIVSVVSYWYAEIIFHFVLALVFTFIFFFTWMIFLYYFIGLGDKVITASLYPGRPRNNIFLRVILYPIFLLDMQNAIRYAYIQDQTNTGTPL